MTVSKKLCGAMGAIAASLFAAAPAFAGPIKAPTVEQMATMVNKGDVAWMLVSSVLVLMMSVPALALFYGGLVRTKNMLSVLMQVFMIVSVAALVWCCWGLFDGLHQQQRLRRRLLQGVPDGRIGHHLCRDVQQQRLSA
jgi:Amt family ammonium transporter